MVEPVAPAASIADRAESAFDDLGGAEIDLSASSSDAPFPDVDGTESAAESGESEEVESEPGSATDPYTVKTLPDAHVTLKIDGEEKVVSLREMTDGYMRQEAFHKRMNQVAALTEQAKAAGAKFQQEKEQFRSSFKGLMQDPDTLFEFLDEHSPDVLDAVSRKTLARVIAWQNDPNARAQHEYQKQQAAIAAERQRFEQERNQYQRSRQEQEAHAKYIGEFKPGYESGMKAAGYPEVNDEFRATVKGIVAAKREATGKITTKDIHDAVVRAARAMGSPTVADRKPLPAPAQQAPKGLRPKPKAAQANKTFSQIFRDLGK